MCNSGVRLPVVVSVSALFLTATASLASAADRERDPGAEAKEIRLFAKWQEFHRNQRRFLAPEAFAEAQTLLRLGLPAAAIDRFETARRLNPEWSLPHLHLALLLIDEARELDRARQALEDAARLAPQNPRVHEALARLREQLDDPGGAADALLTASRLRPMAYPDVDLRLARLLDAAGRKEQARVRYEVVITRRPDDIILLNRLTEICEQLGDWDAAEGYLRTLLRQTRDPRLVHTRLAQFYERKGDLKAARREYRQVKKLQRKTKTKKQRILRPLKKSRK